jgi:hypothetical protein
MMSYFPFFLRYLYKIQGKDIAIDDVCISFFSSLWGKIEKKKKPSSLMMSVSFVDNGNNVPRFFYVANTIEKKKNASSLMVKVNRHCILYIRTKK